MLIVNRWVQMIVKILFQAGWLSHRVSEKVCHKLHLAISPPILHQFSQSQWIWKALEKTFRLIPVMPRNDQYWPRY